MTGYELREWRKNIGLSQTELADLLEIKQNTISRWERSMCRIKHPVLLRSAIQLLEERLYAEEAQRSERKVWVDCMKTYLAVDDLAAEKDYRLLSVTEGTDGDDVLLYVCPVCRRKHAGTVTRR